jgi:hypothetical protein
VHLNTSFPKAFPCLKPIEVTDVDIHLLSVGREAPALLKLQSEKYPEGRPRISHSPKVLPLFNDTTWEISQYVDARLNNLNIWQWTSVPISDSLAMRTISFYLVNEHPILALFDSELFIRDLVAGEGRFCSPLLVSSVLAWCCVSLDPLLSDAASHFQKSRQHTHGSCQRLISSLIASSRRQKSGGKSKRTMLPSRLFPQRCSWLSPAQTCLS